MSQLKVNTIRHTGASSDAIELASDGSCTVKATNNLGNRNIIHNGSFIVHQRGGTTTSTEFLLDRWQCATQGGTATFSQGTETSGTVYEKGLVNYCRITNTANSTAVNSYRYLRQGIEAQNLLKSGWNYKSTSANITLSFYVRSSVAQNFYGYVRLNDSPDSRYAFETGSLSADTWTKVTKVIPGYASGNIDNDNDSGMDVLIAPFWGTNFTASGVALNTWAAWNGGQRFPDYATTWAGTNGATFDVTGFQLEVGDVATDFEHRSYDHAFQTSMRYYFEVGNSTGTWIYLNPLANDNNTIEVMPVFPVPMRAGPTVTATGTINCRACANGNSGSEITLSGSSFNAPGDTVVTGHTWWDATSGTPFSGGYFGRIYGGTSTSSINFSAEL